MPRRSVLFSPGDRPEMLRKAPRTGADVVVFDLEDAVAPDRKAEARETVREALVELGGGDGVDPELCVRINPEGVAADADLDVIYGEEVPRPDSVMVPKVTGADDVRTVDRLLYEHDADPPLLVLVETPGAVLDAPAVAAEDPVDGLVFGAEDYAAAVGATRSEGGEEVSYARQRVVAAAAAAGVDAVDTIHADVGDAEGLRADARRAAGLGFDGKLAVHPDQVPVINEAFSPDADAVEWAARILAAREAAGDRGVFAVDGEMVDAPVIAQAETVVARARAAGVPVPDVDPEAALDGAGDGADGADGDGDDAGPGADAGGAEGGTDAGDRDGDGDGDARWTPDGD